MGKSKGLSATLQLLILLLFVFGSSSCSKLEEIFGKGDNNSEEKEQKDDDLWQDDLRSMETELGTYRLNDNVLILSEVLESMLLDVSEDGTILLDSAAASYSLPSKGNILVCLHMNEKMPYGFEGKITDIVHQKDGTIAIKTEMASLNEIFSVFELNGDMDLSKYEMLDSLGNALEYTTTTIPTDSIVLETDSSLTKGNLDAVTKASFKSARVFKVSFGYPHCKVSGELTVSGSVTIDVDLARNRFYFATDEYAGFDAVFNADLSDSIGYRQTHRLIGTIRLVPLGQIPVFSINVNVYSYISADAGVGVSFEMAAGIASHAHVQHDSNSWSYAVQPGKLSGSNPLKEGLDIYGKASVGMGARSLFGINMFQIPIVNAEFLYADLWAGLSGGFDYSLLESTPFDIVKETKFDLVGRVGLYFDLDLKNPLGNEHLKYSHDLSHTLKIMELYLFPEFSDFKDNQTGQKTCNVSCSQNRSLLVPVRTGMHLEDEDGNDVEDYWGENYWIQSFSPPSMSHNFGDLESGKFYYAYPMVKYFGKLEVVSDESHKFHLDNKVKAKVSDFKMVRASHDKGAYCHDGRYYDYKYECATTVTLDEKSENISDWGYVYEDPDGKKAYISLKGCASPYVDTRYAYYRNASKSTVRLYGYVRYEGDDEFYCDDAKDYDVEFHGGCPDGNHPHAIDLGLPSGTKWCCCNVGASSPEGYGGYYAWGETSEKSQYSWENYAYYDPSTGNFKNIGSDIAGTSYDVARVKMGGTWRMPSKEQIEELMDNCSSHRTQQNGVNGILVTGPNGGQIFLPAAGCRWGGGLDGEGSGGLYWSCTLDPGYDYGAYDLSFYSGYWGWGHDGYRGTGLSVRAVCP